MSQRTPAVGEHVAIEAGQCVGAEAVGEQVIAADALVGDANVARRRGGLQARGEHIGPAVVAVGGGPWPSVMESPRATMVAAPGEAGTSISET